MINVYIFFCPPQEDKKITNAALIFTCMWYTFTIVAALIICECTGIDGRIVFLLFLSPSTAVCKKPCVNGKCVGPDKCLCSTGYKGRQCNEGGV